MNPRLLVSIDVAHTDIMAVIKHDTRAVNKPEIQLCKPEMNSIIIVTGKHATKRIIYLYYISRESVLRNCVFILAGQIQNIA